MKTLVDTNVILDFFLSREPHENAVKKIFELVYQEKLMLIPLPAALPILRELSQRLF